MSDDRSAPRPDEDDTLLDQAFSEMRMHPPAMPEGLMARVLQDAEAARPMPTSRTGLWAQLLSALGGWPGAAGLVATACTGLWIGVAMPSGVTTSFGLTDTAALDIGDPLGTFDQLLVEG
jgi:hypothetical protein